MNRTRAEAERHFRGIVENSGGRVLGIYKGSGNPIECVCKYGHSCFPRPVNVTSKGQGICNACAKINAGRTRSINAWNAFRKLICDMGGTVIETEWLGNGEPHRCICPVGHECAPRPNVIVNGQGMCWECSGKSPVSGESKFRIRLAELGAELLEPYKGSRVPVLVRCAEGHVNKPTPAMVNYGQGVCMTCAYAYKSYPRMERAEADFRARLTELGAQLLEPYRNSHSPHRVRCAMGHECAPWPNAVNMGHGVCAKCAGKEWDIFYVLSNPINRNIKFGITSGSPKIRLSYHVRDGGFSETIRVIEKLPDGIAKSIENSCIYVLRVKGFTPVRGREYYKANALSIVLEIADNWTKVHGGKRAK